MNPGILRNQVVIQRKTSTQSTTGEEVITWVNVAMVWASIEPLRGQEFLEAARLAADIDARIRIRYRAGILPSMRVVFGERIFDIQAVIHVKELKREMQLMVKERIDG